MKKLAAGFLAVAMLTACGGDEEVTEETVPRVKLYTVGAADSERSRRFSGSVAASEEAPLSFALSGTVEEIRVNVGDVVREGQLLARLDDEPMRIALDSARANLAVSRANLDEAKSTYDRFTRLSSSGAVSQADLETATAAYSSARSSVRGAQADIDRLERDLENASLVAPFDGTVAARSIEPFQEVTPGQAAFVLETTASLEASVQIPENMIGEVSIGDYVDVRFPALPDVTARGAVQTIGSRAESGNAFTVTVLLFGDNPGVRPGMTAGVTFNLSDSDGELVYLIPVSAIAIDVGLARDASPTNTPTSAPVLVFNEESSLLELRIVEFGDLRGNDLEVVNGLSEGDKIVSAGVPFLREGQQVEEWRPAQGLNDG